MQDTTAVQPLPSIVVPNLNQAQTVIPDEEEEVSSQPVVPSFSTPTFSQPSTRSRSSR